MSPDVAERQPFVCHASRVSSCGRAERPRRPARLAPRPRPPLVRRPGAQTRRPRGALPQPPARRPHSRSGASASSRPRLHGGAFSERRAPQAGTLSLDLTSRGAHLLPETSAPSAFTGAQRRPALTRALPVRHVLFQPLRRLRFVLLTSPWRGNRAVSILRQEDEARVQTASANRTGPDGDSLDGAGAGAAAPHRPATLWVRSLRMC